MRSLSAPRTPSPWAFSVLIVHVVVQDWVQGHVNVAGTAGGLVPAWPQTWHLPTSTVVMPCNYSGMIPENKLAGWGLVDFDWSNAKALWVNESPMDCQERLLAQAQVVKRATPSARVLVYRNLVKALPWFSDVRAKLADPAYAGWFLKYKPGGSVGPGKWHSPPCTLERSGKTKCSPFYHDLEQTPVADSPATRVQDGSWFIYNATNDVNGLAPGYVGKNGKRCVECLVNRPLCVCMCVCMCVRVCVRVCVC